MNLTFITSNPSKADQLSRHLNIEIAHRQLDLVEVQSLDLEEVVEYKVKEAYRIIKAPVLVEDVSLTFAVLQNQLPGPLIKWFFQELGNDGLCKLVEGKDKAAQASVLFGLYDGEQLTTYLGEVEGKIADKPQGKSDFGWDPIFIPNGYNKSWAQMDEQEQRTSSMRRIALEKLEKYLRASSSQAL